jgi:hypothetical protein
MIQSRTVFIDAHGVSQSRVHLGEGAGEAASAVRKRQTPNPKRQKNLSELKIFWSLDVWKFGISRLGA